MRLFVALPLPDAVRQGLLEPVREWKRACPQARWTKPADWHVTLRFLGDVPEERAQEVLTWFHRSLEDAEGGSFELGRTGFFNRREQFVLWVGFEKAGWMGRLAGRLGGVVAGIEPEARPFQAHLTLARMQVNRRKEGNWRPFVERFTNGKLPPLSVPATDVILYQSELSAAGAHYERMAAVPILA